MTDRRREPPERLVRRKPVQQHGASHSAEDLSTVLGARTCCCLDRRYDRNGELLPACRALFQGDENDTRNGRMTVASRRSGLLPFGLALLDLRRSKAWPLKQ